MMSTFVALQDNRNVCTDSSQVILSVGNILVGDAFLDVKHIDCTLPLNVVPITKSTIFFLAWITLPNIELDWTMVGVKQQWEEL